MKDPYEVLNVNRNASEEEIKSAYRKLCRKYHPDRYADNPLKDLAEEKMREINEAYDYIMNNKNNTGSNNYNSIRMDLQKGNIGEAERKLNTIDNKTAEWYFLMGIVYQGKGWYDGALDSINTAISMEPNNMEYRQAYDSLINANNSYRQPYKERGDKDLCQICTTLYCFDCLCESTGGDLIPCC